MEERMKRLPRIVAAGSLALAVATAMGIDVNRAKADADRASNSQLKGQYAGTNSGGCLVSLSGFDQNDRPVDPKTSYSTLWSSEVVFTFDGRGRGKVESNVVDTRVPGPNTSFVPQVTLSTGGGNFTYSVGPKGTVTVTWTNPSFTILNGLAAGLTVVVNEVVLEGHFGPNGVTLVKTDGAVETVNVSNGSSYSRICQRAIVLLSDGQRF
jgi:hypothetical protein